MARLVKRILDVTTALTALVVLSPVLLATALAIRFTMGRPVLFRQVRPGYRSRPFVLLKFRTMTEDSAISASDVERLATDGRRLTRLGRWLRRTSVDELPQLWNVLKGEMSLVGPRPLLMEYLPLYDPHQARRHEVRPGITGWAQVNGRNEADWVDRLNDDVWYVDHWSLSLDLRIIARTIATVAGGRGVSRKGQATMVPFQGSAGRGR
jgi:lipopolysaccharide/colanic/teichoic acid biosynthesis glycosyltransferase